MDKRRKRRTRERRRRMRRRHKILWGNINILFSPTTLHLNCKILRTIPVNCKHLSKFLLPVSCKMSLYSCDSSTCFRTWSYQVQALQNLNSVTHVLCSELFCSVLCFCEGIAKFAMWSCREFLIMLSYWGYSGSLCTPNNRVASSFSSACFLAQSEQVFGSLT